MVPRNDAAVSRRSADHAMKLSELADQLELQSLTPDLAPAYGADVAWAFASDLLSDVLANAPAGGVLVTVQAHMNVLAVAVHAEMAAVIFASGRVPDDAMLRKAVEEGMPLFGSKAATFDLVGRLYQLGLRGHHP
jgi:hypothetical protein